MTFKITTNDQVHFIGIGGIGMSGIAEIMHNIGFKVQGSDPSRNNKNIKRLQKLGLKLLTYYAEFKRNKKRMEQAINEISTCAISGAVGTFAHINPRIERSNSARS